MFIIKKSTASEFLDVDLEDFVVTSLLSKYDIKTNTTFLDNVNDDYNALINYINELYIDNEKIPNDIAHEITSNINFKKYLLSYIQNKMKNILDDSTTIVFKEIIIIINLLSMGKKFEIFESYNFYNMEILGNLFREYEKVLKDLKDKEDEENFDLTFELYTILIEVINELCTINSIDILRKKTINPLVNVISETINIVKFNLNLDEDKINTLNNILGKLLFYYSHIPYIDTSNKNCEYLIEEFTFNFEKIYEGYDLSKNTNFANDANCDEYYYIFLNSSTTLLLNLLYKLELTYEENSYNSVEKFKEIINLYKQIIIHKNVPVFNSLNSFKEELLSNYSYIYFKDYETKNYEDIINEFIENCDFNSSNMHIIYSLILYSSNIDDDKMFKILEILLDFEKFKNDYHEFYKLNICDVIINKFINQKSDKLDSEIIKKIIDYIEENKIASHLMSIYSKLYLSLSLYFSYYYDYDSIKNSSLYYFYYISINGKDLLENEYAKLNKDILYNHGKSNIQRMNLEGVFISDSKYVEIGQKLMNEYFKQEEINLKYQINQDLSNIVTKIFNDEGLNNQLLNTYIEQFISKDIFYGLTFVAVEGLCEKDCILIDLGYERLEIPLIEGYKLKIAYSKVYKHIFENIYQKNKDYIKQNIINLIISYIKSIPIYQDTVTTLYNKNKLQAELLQKDENEEFILVEIYINDFIELNSKFHYKKVNQFFKDYVLKINEFIPLYRFYGPRIAFILNKNEDYKQYIEKIKELNFITKDGEIKPNLTISVSWGYKDNIIEKSLHSLDLAMSNEDRYNEFK
ncbi:hypothetical protein [Arcobacter arenosus]|uniref:Uncharacterized protein n=1 Tax=Arcobacter arenosus TaxID=2576037 RepID=A0A5R8Y3N5_9BACT|nr:hypothetical protein [Arcobacter arenosus]TLP40686.1 hypothetical protein FDK22_01345 [Arcobacter arenosus]